MQKILIRGIASGKIIKELAVHKHYSSTLSLMDFLIDNRITIASSCAGAGTCKKCIVNKDLLSCQITLKEFLGDKECAVVEVSYL